MCKGDVKMKDLIEIIKSRKTIRSYSDQKVERDLIIKIIEAAKHAPTGMNKQGRRYTIVENADIIHSLEQGVENALQRKGYKLFDAKTLIIISVPKDLENGLADTSVAMQNMYLACNYYGLGCCWINQFKHINDDEKIRELFTEIGIPEDEVVYAAMTVGYPNEEPGQKERVEEYFFID